jgi:mono/diheme cytochrome c family protein
MSRMFGCLSLLILVAVLPAAEAPSPLMPLQLSTIDGGQLSLPPSDAPRATVLCFLGTECPLARLYGPRLQALHKHYEERGVRFVGINSNQQDSLEEVKQYAAHLSLSFPLAKDYDHAAADRFRVERTPEVCLLDGTGQVIYRGRIDDQHHPGVTKPVPTRNDLQAAIDDLLAGRPVAVPQTTAVGCRIGRKPAAQAATNLTYCKDVSRILQQHCVECHRAGDIGPFALTDFDEVTGWGETLLEVIADGRMPPWHASEASVPFVNARAMPQADRDALAQWVHGGMPYGSPEDLPEPLPTRADWSLARQPDVVIPMRATPFKVPAEGVVEYQYFVADPHLTEDKWVVGAEVIPGARSVVHHVIVFIRPPDGVKLRGMGWLTAYVPGQRLSMLPPGMGRLIPAGSKLVFQMHYTPNGAEQQDLSQLGLVFGDDSEITEELFTLMAINQNFEIPPGAADHAVHATLDNLPPESRLLALAPHMHVRGKGCQVTARGGDGSSVVLDVPHYDFNWQHVYALRDPRHRPPGVHGPLRQLARQPGQSRPDAVRPLGRSDLGGDDSRLLRGGPAAGRSIV